jgi:effector-binding domain-containing protein
VEIERVVLTPTPTAVVRAELAPSEITSRIISMFDAVYASLDEAGAVQDGQNVAVYRPIDHGHLLVEAGVQVKVPFADCGELVCSEIPGGAALHFCHRGDYSTIGEWFEAMFAFAAEGALITTGVTVEIYGDWAEDPDDCVADLYVLLDS